MDRERREAWSCVESIAPMAIELKVPTVGESITEVLLVRWFKNEGDHAEKDEPLVEIETDKATFELPAPAAGTLSQIVKKARRPRQVGEVIAYFETGEAAPPRRAPRRARPPREQRPPVRRGPPAASPRQPGPAKPAEPPRVMPAARREMEQRGLKPEQVQPTGPGGRITKEDVTRQASSPRPRKAPDERPATERRPDMAQPTAEPAPRPEPEPQTAAGTFPPGNREEDVVPMSPMRQRIAERLVAGPAERRPADDLQRGRHVGRARPAPAAPGGLPEEVRRQARLHVVLREGVRRGPQAVPAAQRRDPRHRHRLPQLLRHRHRRRPAARAWSCRSCATPSG